MALDPAQWTRSEYGNAQEANKKYFSSGGCQSTICEDFLKELNEKSKKAQVISVKAGNWRTVKAVNIDMNDVDITGLSSGAFIREMQQIIQAIKEKHDELQILHRPKGFRLTIIKVVYRSGPLSHHCQHKVWEDGQPGNYEYTDVGQYEFEIKSRMSTISANISDSGVAKVLRAAGCSGQVITADLVGKTLSTTTTATTITTTSSRVVKISAEDAGCIIIKILVQKHNFLQVAISNSTNTNSKMSEPQLFQT
jgi:hypothetical protein